MGPAFAVIAWLRTSKQNSKSFNQLLEDADELEHDHDDTIHDKKYIKLRKSKMCFVLDSKAEIMRTKKLLDSVSVFDQPLYSSSQGPGMYL